MKDIQIVEKLKKYRIDKLKKEKKVRPQDQFFFVKSGKKQNLNFLI